MASAAQITVSTGMAMDSPASHVVASLARAVKRFCEAVDSCERSRLSTAPAEPEAPALVAS